MRYILFLIISTWLVNSCNKTQDKLDKAWIKIEYAEENYTKMTAEEWRELELVIIDLNSDMELNRQKYSDVQIKEIGKIKGRYTSILLKKGINDFKDSVKDLNNQIEGFMDGINDNKTTKTKTHEE